MTPDDIETLKRKIEMSLDYFEVEFPKNGDRNKQVWAEPISYHCGGISPDDLVAIKALLSKPVAALPAQGDGEPAVFTEAREEMLDGWGEAARPATMGILPSGNNPPKNNENDQNITEREDSSAARPDTAQGEVDLALQKAAERTTPISSDSGREVNNATDTAGGAE